MNKSSPARVAGILAAAVLTALTLAGAANAQATHSQGAAAKAADTVDHVTITTPTRVYEPRRSCASLASLDYSNTTISSATEVAATTSTPAYCDVQASVTNPPAYTDTVNIGVFLPVQDWNGAFEGTGGGGFDGGDPTTPDASALQDGYVTAGTDAGHTGSTGNFALNADGTLNWQEIDDFGYLGIHEMTVLAKAVTAAYYNKAPAYSFFNGCSTGGRQGLIEAQRYPQDYNGIAAGSPAINSNLLRASQIWGFLQMDIANDVLPQCKLDAFNSAAVAACGEKLDGVADGIISDWQHCDFDPRTLIGTVTPCGTITATDAEVVSRIWQGPVDADGHRLWYGLMPGASFTGLDDTVTTGSTTTAAPFSIVTAWYQYWLTQNPNYNWQTMTYQQFLNFYQQSASEFSGLDVTSESSPDLSAFKKDGGKIIMWIGTYDQLVYPLGDLNYFKRVEATFGGAGGGAAQTAQFLRFFMAPGVEHCGGGPGATPVNAFQAVVNWVEDGHAPAQLEGEATNAAGQVDMTRPVCMYPLVARYNGGNPDVARSFSCATSLSPEQLPSS